MPQRTAEKDVAATEGCAAVTGYALTETQARSLHENLRVNEERVRNWARSAQTVDEYDCPCRLANALSDAMEAISDMILKGQCVDHLAHGARCTAAPSH